MSEFIFDKDDYLIEDRKEVEQVLQAAIKNRDEYRARLKLMKPFARISENESMHVINYGDRFKCR